jgi:predicted MPP superfamily phosphohydrolase
MHINAMMVLILILSYTMVFTEKRVKDDFVTEYFKKGKMRHKSIHYCKLSDTFPDVNRDIINNIIIMSDIHGATTEAINLLIKKKLMTDKSLVITTGDMCGDPHPDKNLGTNADPYHDYVTINDTVPYFYFVQGNHDLSNRKTYDLKNVDGSSCYLDQKVISTPIGRIGGVSGIVVPETNINDKLHKYDEETYIERLTDILDRKPDVLLTHMPIFNLNLDNSIMDNLLYFFGHTHYTNYILDTEPGLSLNRDGRIFVFE